MDEARYITYYIVFFREFIAVSAELTGYEELPNFSCHRPYPDGKEIPHEEREREKEEFVQSELYQEMCREAWLGLRQAVIEYAEELKKLVLSIDWMD